MLTFRIAGVGSRLAAYLIDLCVRIGIYLGVIYILNFFLSLGPFLEDLGSGIILLLLFLLEWGYGGAFEAWWGGQTPGKKAMRIRVVRTDGCPVTLADAMLRNFLRAADAQPAILVFPTYALGLVTTFFNRRSQRVGDLVAGTMVVQEKRPRIRKTLPKFLEYLPFEKDEVRQSYRPGPRTLEVIEGFCWRREELSPARAEEIAKILAVPLAERLGYEGAVEQDPLGFLMRTLVTYYGPGEEDQSVSKVRPTWAGGDS